MPSFKSLATGLVALLAADAVIAGPCRVRSTTASVSAPSSTASIASTETTTGVTSSSTSAAVESSSSTETILSTTVTSSETSTGTETSKSETETASSSETVSTSASTGTTTGTETASTTATSATDSTSTETASTTGTTSASETASSSTVPSTTETASSTEESSTASSTVSSSETTTAPVTTSTTAVTSSTSAIASTSTTSEAPPTLPTIANAGFDDNANGAPWDRSSGASVSSATVYWKRSQPNVMVIRPGSSFTQEITGLRPNLGYRIRFYWVKFDTPSATGGCKLSPSFGGEDLGEVALLPPRTPNNVFEEYVSTVFQPSSTSAELKIAMTCTANGQSNRFVVDDVSIEFA